VGYTCSFDDQKSYLQEARREYEFSEFEENGNVMNLWRWSLGALFILIASFWFYRWKFMARNADTSSLTIKERRVFETLQKGMTN